MDFWNYLKIYDFEGLQFLILVKPNLSLAKRIIQLSLLPYAEIEFSVHTSERIHNVSRVTYYLNKHDTVHQLLPLSI